MTDPRRPPPPPPGTHAASTVENIITVLAAVGIVVALALVAVFIAS